MKKYFKFIYLIVLLEIMLWGLITKNSNIFLFGSINCGIFMFFFPKVIQSINFIIKSYIIHPIFSSSEGSDLLTSKIKYLFKNYLFIIFIIYFLIAILDNYFISIFYLDLYIPILLLIIGFFIIYDNVLALDIYWGKRKIELIDFVFVFCFVFLFYLWLGLSYLNIKYSFIISSFITLVLYIGLIFSTKLTDKKIYKMFSVRFYLVILFISLLYQLIFSFIDLKGLIIREKIVKQDHIIYINKDINNITATNQDFTTKQNGNGLSGNKSNSNIVLNSNTGFTIINNKSSTGNIDIESKYKGIKYKTTILNNKKGKIFVLKEYVNGIYIVIIGSTKKEFNNKIKAEQYGINYSSQ